MTEIARLLLPWFDRYGRKDLPWQQEATPYKVWLSEIMLQQTQVSTVIPYFERFLSSFPDVLSLADAPLDQVLQHWAGLGYYARARNLHKSAQILRDRHQGDFPRQLEALLALPGIGRSTAGAIISLAFSRPAPILDGNVKRVLTRLFQVPGWSAQSATRKQLWALAETHTPQQRCAAYNQAMMDLGSLICKRSAPACDQCPLSGICLSFRHQTQALFPQPKPKRKRNNRHRWFLLHRNAHSLLLERRPQQGIWGGLWSLPELDSLDQLDDWQINRLGESFTPQCLHEHLLKHQFTHFDLSMSVADINLPQAIVQGGHRVAEDIGLRWVDWSDLEQLGMPAPVARILRSYQ